MVRLSNYKRLGGALSTPGAFPFGAGMLRFAVLTPFGFIFSLYPLYFISFLQFSNFILQILIKNVDTQIGVRYTLNIDSKGAAE